MTIRPPSTVKSTLDPLPTFNASVTDLGNRTARLLPHLEI